MIKVCQRNLYCFDTKRVPFFHHHICATWGFPLNSCQGMSSWMVFYDDFDDDDTSPSPPGHMKISCLFIIIMMLLIFLIAGNWSLDMATEELFWPRLQQRRGRGGLWGKKLASISSWSWSPSSWFMIIIITMIMITIMIKIITMKYHDHDHQYYDHQYHDHDTYYHQYHDHYLNHHDHRHRADGSLSSKGGRGFAKDSTSGFFLLKFNKSISILVNKSYFTFSTQITFHTCKEIIFHTWIENFPLVNKSFFISASLTKQKSQLS